MPMHYGMPHPAINVGDLIESLKVLPPDAPIALVEVSQDWDALGAPPVTTLTLKVWGGFELGARTVEANHKALPSKPKALPKQPARLT